MMLFYGDRQESPASLYCAVWRFEPVAEQAPVAVKLIEEQVTTTHS